MSQSFWILMVFVFGLLFGSFLNVVIFRIDELETIWLSRSHCPKCRHILAWYDLIPFFSFVILKTRCRYCQKSISWQYPLVEIGTALVISLSYLFLVTSGRITIWEFMPLILVLGTWVVIFVYDLKTMTIPMEILIAGIAFSLIYLLIRFDYALLEQSLIAAISMALVPLVIIILGKIFIKKDVMGAGDIFLAFSLGLLLTLETGLLTLVTSFIIGGIISLALILLKKVKLGSYQEIAFGPFLITGAIISLWWGNDILKWFLIY